jgi:amidophosphoribosyltransferase
MNYEHGLIRNHYVGRTFIEPSQKIRSLGVKLKLNANQTTIKDKKIILIDDSLLEELLLIKLLKCFMMLVQKKFMLKLLVLK